MIKLQNKKENELQQEIEQLEKMATGEFGGIQHKQRYINILNKQIEEKRSEIAEKQATIEKLKETGLEINARLEGVIEERLTN